MDQNITTILVDLLMKCYCLEGLFEAMDMLHVQYLLRCVLVLVALLAVVRM
jgi:hypothetical protein